MSTASWTFTPNRAGVEVLLHSPAGPLGQRFTQFCNRVANTAKEYANVDTGLMRSTIRFDVTTSPTGLVGTVGAYTDYAIYVHELYNPFLTRALADEASRGL